MIKNSLTLCAAVGLSAAAFASNPIARIRPRLASDVKASGWTIGCEVQDRKLAIFDEYKDFLPPLGMKRIRLQGGWARCEKEKGVYDFAWLDESVDYCRAHDIGVLLETSYGNPIYEGAGGWDLGGGFPKSEEGLAAWDRWVEALAKHFKGRVTDWAMWNEPDLKGGKGRVAKTPEEIGAFNVRTARIIKRIIPDARIAGLSLAYNDPVLLERCLKAMEGGLDLFSSIIYHGYSANPDDSYENVGRQKEVLRRLAPHLRLEQGENGAPSAYCTAYALSKIPWNELSQAKWNLRRMLGDLGHDVDSSLFTIIEFSQGGRPLNPKGILRSDKNLRFIDVKTAYCAARNLAAVFDRSVVRRRDDKSRISVKRGSVFVYDAPKGRIVTYWDASARPDETLHPVSGELVLDGPALKDPVLVDLIAGDVFAVPDGDVSASDEGCVYRNLPIHDYPWLLAEKASLPLAPSRAAPHPRLLADAGDFARIRALKDELSVAVRRKVVQIAEAELATAPVVYKKEGRRLLGVSREALRRISACAMAWRLTDDRRFADRAVKEALAVSAFQDWNNSHFLDTAEMCLAAAIAYDWCFDAIGAEDRKTIEDAILSKALVKEDGRLIDGWFTHAVNNWGQVCQAGLCAGAIALSDVAPLVSDRVIARAVGCLPRCMTAYAEGGFPEGPAGYWFYAMDFTAVVIAELEKAYGTDFGLGATPGLDRQADFIDNLTGPTGQLFNFADGGHYKVQFKGVTRHPAISEWFLADKFNTPEVLFRHERGLLAKAVNDPKRTGFDRLFPLTLLWMKDVEQVSVPAAPKSVRVGGRVPVGVLRAGEGREGSFAALKGGKGSDHHGHLDIGSFVYDADGIRWVIDLGAENYNSVEQAGLKLWDLSDDSQRWDIFRLGTFAHNVFSLDGKNARASGFADIKVDGNTASADLTACYPGAAKAVRTMTLDEKTLTIRDELEGLAPGTVVDWHFITDSRAEIAGPGMVKLSALGRTRTVSSSAANWKVVSVAEPPHPCESRNPGVVRVSFETKAPASGKVALTVTFGR